MKYLLTLAVFASVMSLSVSAQNSNIGYFDVQKDLLVMNFDSKPDVDDLMAVAAAATMLNSDILKDVAYYAIAGSYGTQKGTFIEAKNLFNLAFGDRWLDAHSKREETVTSMADAFIQTLNSGGDIWIAEAGQSDVSADILKIVKEQMPYVKTKDRIHLVQHSFWNESVTTKEKFNYVRNYTDYSKIPDGNASANGTPNFRTSDTSSWQNVLNHSKVGKIWTEAQRLSMEYNVVAGYNNEAIGAGGMDFSDVAELCWIFGFSELEGVPQFFATFL